MDPWAIDLGTTNTTVARWDARAERAVVVVLAGLCRDPQDDDPVHAPDAIPSATEMVLGADLWTRLGRLPVVARRAFWGRHAWIGRPALERNLTHVKPSFAASFKPYLQHEALRPIANVGLTRFTARDVARAYLRELLAEAHRATGERLRSVTVTTPVDAYEGYRAELSRLFASFGVAVHKFVDEPVAAAVGYGLSVHDRRRVLVIDMGGGTTDVALVDIDAHTAGTGRATVIAKAGRPIAGDLVDRWLVELVCARLERRPPDDAFWQRLMLDEARSLKERLFGQEQEVFHLRPPGASPGGEIAIARDDLVSLLAERGLYAMLQGCLDEVVGAESVDDVLLVGGSTLLPGVFPLVERRFGRDRVRGWQPFHAVATGACAFAARGFTPVDHIVHEYAVLLHEPDSGARRYETIVPAGTRFPASEVWRRQLRPICPFGVPERVYKLVVCEIGRAPEAQRSFGWDESGRLHQLGDGHRLVVPLNESDPALGVLDPPHPPGDPAPRLDVSFGVNADKWLVATVFDLRARRMLLDAHPVVRLL